MKPRSQGPDLASLARMVDLEDLAVSEIRCSDAVLAHLSGLTKLKSLNLSGKRITNAGLGHLALMTNDGSLDPAQHRRHQPGTDPRHDAIETTQSRRLTDRRRRSATCRAFQSLESLDLGDARITDHGVAAISRLPNLKMLKLEQTRIGDAGLALLCDNPRINFISLSATDVTDAGLAGVVDKLNAGMCQSLRISSPKLTRAGLNSAWDELTHTQIANGSLDDSTARSAILNILNRKPTADDDESPQ